MRRQIFFSAWLVGVTGSVLGAEDVLLADFEQETHGDWKVEGEAFGPGPARGTLPGQMHVSGYRGERLVNSFFEGDGTTGTLTSPPFMVERDYLTFLVGGGGHEGRTCMNLIVDGEVVWTVTGANERPGGSEALEAAAWDVRKLRGKTARIQIVDRETGGWGHVNVDHIVLTDEKPKIPERARRQKEFVVAKEYLVMPIDDGGKATELVLEIDGEAVRRYGVELAANAEDADWYAYFTIDSYRGQPATVTATRATEEGFALVRQEDVVPGSEEWYDQPLRPQFHFTQAVGWNNDPNGMVHLDGEWHLFFQHNPVGWKWGNMTWGHAVSRDLVHWEQLPNKLFPKTMAVGDCFSGGGTVDVKNTAGWKTGENDVLVVFLTDTGAGESVAYSNDKGRTFTWYEGNPVVKHKGRDPKVIWYEYDDNDTPLNARARELGGHWVMIVYDEHEEYGQNAAFYTSTNLKEWTEQSHLPGYFECTELFELPIDGNDDETRWVVFAADARYALGSFDGRTFTPDHEGKHQVHWGAYYASQTFDNAPDGRRIQMGWVRIATPGMPFNQTFSFPHELTLRTTTEGVRMCAEPVKEIEILHEKKRRTRGQELGTDPVTVPVTSGLLDIRATFELGDADRVGMRIGGNPVVYDVAAGTLNEAALKPVDGMISMQVLVDRQMMEICGNDGRVFITSERQDKGAFSRVEFFAEEGTAKVTGVEIYELKSIWE